jgi:hypothetical protein
VDFEIKNRGDMLTESKVFIVTLRQPKKTNENKNEKEQRLDPFWEKGSFGLTGCHKHGLLNPKRAQELTGARLAFAQGGPEGFKLILITDEINVVLHKCKTEVKWSRVDSTFKYKSAPCLINNLGDSDFQLLKEYIVDTNCPSLVSGFSSKFRNRCSPLPKDIAKEMICVFEQKVTVNDPTQFISTFIDALPYPPNDRDYDREEKYNNLLQEAGRKNKCK